MKVYYRKFSQDDFTQAGTVWTTSASNLYSNGCYSNFSTTKASYGSNLLGNNTWTGLNSLANGTASETGYILNGRWVDTSGRIDIETFYIDFDRFVGDEELTPTLSVYTSPDPGALFPNEWTKKDNLSLHAGIFIVKSYSNAIFSLDFGRIVDPADVEFTLWIRISIDSPIMAPLYERTRRVLDKFPEWMEMRELGHEDSATPHSLGGQLLNAVAGEWLQDIDQTITYQNLQQYIDTADTTQLAWAYYASEVPDRFCQVNGDGVLLSRTVNLSEFYALLDTEDGFYWDEAKRNIYTNKQYDTLTIDGVTFTQSPQQIWNWFDEFGALLDLPRHQLEDNVTYKLRIKDVYINRPGVGVEAFKQALRRELNLWRAQGATPDSSTPTYYPEVLEIEDIENSAASTPSYMHYNRLPKQNFIDLVEELASAYPTTWGFFRWNQAYWDVGGVDGEGYSKLPYRYDAELPESDDIQAGVGDGDDLLIFKPDVIEGARDFNARLTIRGRHRTWRQEYPPLKFSVEIYGQADRRIYTNPITTSWITVNVVVGATNYYHSFQMSAQSDVSASNLTNPTAESWATYDIFDSWGWTQAGLTWQTSTTTFSSSSATPFQIQASTITTLRAYFGRYDQGTNTIVDTPGASVAKLWWSDDAADTITSPSLSSPVTGNQALYPKVIMSSLQTQYVVGKWESEKYLYEVTLNGAPPTGGILNVTIPAPNIVWDGSLEATPNKEYGVRIVSLDSAGTRGGYTTDANNKQLFVPATHIAVNGASNWDSSGEITRPLATTQFVFSTVAAATPVYPLQFPVWSLFEAQQTSTIPGIVDENGPWREGQPSVLGNTNYNFAYVEVNRTDFSIPNTQDYIVTWIGIDADDPYVVVWLDTNTVRSNTLDQDTTQLYSRNALYEFYDDDANLYYLQSFVARARLKAGITPEWYPKIHSGYFYDKNDEYYFYINPVVEHATTNVKLLRGVSYQGAPIVAKTNDGRELRQVAIYDDNADALVLTEKETVQGTGTNKLYLAYGDCYAISVVRNDTGETIGATSTTAVGTNEVSTNVDTVVTATYTVTYRVKLSFLSDNEFRHSDGTHRSQVEFDAPPSAYGATQYHITYESSKYETATPIPVPLNPLYTTIDEGFIFISHEEYDLGHVEVRFSPSRIVADGKDFAIITVKALDVHSDPKAGQVFNLVSSFGTLEDASLTTGDDGIARTRLTAAASTASLTGTLTITGAANRTVTFDIVPTTANKHNLTAVVKPTHVPADGKAKVVVHGVVEDATYSPVPYAVVQYRKGRTMYEVFTQATSTTDPTTQATPNWVPSAGQVVTDNKGRFTLGPFTSATPYDPGYWFLAAETEAASPTTYTTLRTNLVKNPSFEVNTTDWAALSNSSIARVTTWASSGTASCRMTATAGGEMTSGTTAGLGAIPVIAGQKYYVQMVSRAATTPRISRVIIIFYNSLGNYNGIDFTPEMMNSTSTDTKTSAVITAPPGTQYLAVAPSFVGCAAAEQHYFDSVMVEKRDTIGIYFDGTFASDGYISYVWTGTAHNSTSIQRETVRFNKAGDVVYWHEYPPNNSLEIFTGSPKQIILGQSTDYATNNRYPVPYDDATPYMSATPNVITWKPPTWYAIDKYTQYQLGLLGNGFYTIDIGNLPNAHPDYKDQ